MPSCRPALLTPVVELVMKIKPTSILDVGAGFGKWGALFREYLEIWQGRYKREDWKIRIDALEPWLEYHSSPLYEVYNDVYAITMEEFLEGEDFGAYDLIFMIEVIEHMEKETAEKLLPVIETRAKKALIITSPVGGSPQGAVFGNEYEKHCSAWRSEDFMRIFHKGNYVTIDNRYGLFWIA